MFDKHYVGSMLTGFEDNGKTRPVSRVTLLVDNETVITAGDDTGLELTADCPHATQAMAEAILEAVKGHSYQMYKADAATLDPAAELGDGITAGGVYSVISRLDDDGSYPNLSAPGEEEMEDEYPVTGPMTQSFNRKVAETRAQIIKTAEEIRLEVSSELENVKGELSLKVGRDENDQIVSMLNASADEINIKGNRFVLDSTNFKVSADGTIEANSGIFTGTIYANKIQVGGAAGYVTGSQIGSSTISSNNLGSGSVINAKIGGGAVSYGKVNFTGTLDQVGVNKSNIESINGYFTGTANFNFLAANSFYLNGKRVFAETYYIDGKPYQICTWDYS